MEARLKKKEIEPPRPKEVVDPPGRPLQQYTPLSALHFFLQNSKRDISIDDTFGHRYRMEHTQAAKPQVGVRSVINLKNKFVEKDFRPEDNIRPFEGALEYFLKKSPEQLLSACRGIFPLPIKPCFVFQQVWGNFVT
ncbi:hypothetical protein DQ04_05101040 [Trypanosoma grayi]|uniref:hypothetical protein n=1 Tax=Trypanosoma grayi TaxID=71804 RepID=UPI0004F49222|nr:hypothetical protein DQ04_05101040 [Trypanosoma grayi]KEG09512.1 hypothetical protein DQ04_05101040 [Trypanosoma grayi]